MSKCVSLPPPPVEELRLLKGRFPTEEWWSFHVSELHSDWNMLQTIYESESCFSSDGVSGREKLLAQHRMHSMISPGKRLRCMVSWHTVPGNLSLIKTNKLLFNEGFPCSTRFIYTLFSMQFRSDDQIYYSVVWCHIVCWKWNMHAYVYIRYYKITYIILYV